MKKFLFSFVIIASFFNVNAQTLQLNELYVRPNLIHNRHEYFELFNPGVDPAGMNSDCYTLVTYFEENGVTGFYVLDLPNKVVPAGGFLVGAAADPFDYQNADDQDADFSWNDPTLPAQNGSLKKFVRSGGTYVEEPVPADFNNLFDLYTDPSGAYVQMLFFNGTLVDFFLGAYNKNKLPSNVTDHPPLNIDMAGACTDFTITFSALVDATFEHVNANAGTDNGYYRKGDGRCGEWEKSSAPKEHTPGASNGLIGADAGAIVFTISYNCNNGLLTIDIISGPNVNIMVYLDNAPINVLDLADVLIGSQANVAPGSTFSLPGAITNFNRLIITFDATDDCGDRVFPIECSDETVLPVSFLSFKATRIRSQVDLNWVTASEQNNTGFEVQRNSGSGNWQKAGFIASRAPGGNSNTQLSYSFNDLNTTKAITQYRIVQIDMNGKTRFSEVRAVRGEGQKMKTIIYPNPASDGKVNVVFEDINVIRDVFLLDISGRTLKQWKKVNNNNLQIENLTPGIYHLRIVEQETGEQSVEKILINKR